MKFLKIIPVLIILGFASVAQAQTPIPQGGGCFDNITQPGQPTTYLFCVGPVAQATVTKIGLSSGNKGITSGFSTGVGLGLTIAPDMWYASGIDLFLNVNSSSTNALSTLPAAANSKVTPMLMLNMLSYLFVGVGADVVAPADSSGSYTTGWFLTLGIGSTINSITPGYAKKEAARQAADRARAADEQAAIDKAKAEAAKKPVVVEPVKVEAKPVVAPTPTPTPAKPVAEPTKPATLSMR